ncbi:hypothetical protein AVEN_60119-1 [Araneus ventricosus]|uniref:Uncharacterized protein n=1 Tax=Araneus ventricosus TaxID=182803 RepID=A0A4Y2GHS9_ARAVE|nr:hypothetical protein AVEN_60119-1 [Araneus ventricosus]
MSSPSATKPVSLPIWVIIIRFPFPEGDVNPEERPDKNTCFEDFIEVPFQALLTDTGIRLLSNPDPHTTEKQLWLPLSEGDGRSKGNQCHNQQQLYEAHVTK